MTDEYKTINDEVGLLGGTVLLLGTVIGITVFLLPGELIGDAGPSIVLALAVTAIPMTFAVLCLLQLGGAIPVAGGIYVYASRLLGPFWGFLAIWLMVPAIWSVLLFTAIGFADFTQFFYPDISAALLMVAVLTALLLLNLRGITIVAQIQLMMVSGIILGMIAFIVTGIPNVDTAYYSDPFFAGGAEGFIVAMISLYIPFQGFTMIIELGEELEDPVKNIPRVLGLGMVLAVILSLAFVAVFAGLGDWRALAALDEGAVAHAASNWLPTGIGPIVAIAAVLGALTTLNALLTSYSRTIMRAARDEIMPARFAEVHDDHGVPYLAVLLLGAPPILMVPFALEVGAVPLSIFLGLILLFANILMGLALWRLPKRYPKRYEYSIYKLPMPMLKVSAVCLSGFSTIFWLATLTELPEIIALIVALIVIGYGLYRLRIQRYADRGIDLKEKMSMLDTHEQGSSSTESSD